jgi:hypothetical protein
MHEQHVIADSDAATVSSQRGKAASSSRLYISWFQINTESKSTKQRQMKSHRKQKHWNDLDFLDEKRKIFMQSRANQPAEREHRILKFQLKLAVAVFMGAQNGCDGIIAERYCNLTIRLHSSDFLRSWDNASNLEPSGRGKTAN